MDFVCEVKKCTIACMFLTFVHRTCNRIYTIFMCTVCSYMVYSMYVLVQCIDVLLSIFRVRNLSTMHAQRVCYACIRCTLQSFQVLKLCIIYIHCICDDWYILGEISVLLYPLYILYSVHVWCVHCTVQCASKQSVYLGRIG